MPVDILTVFGEGGTSFKKTSVDIPVEEVGGVDILTEFKGSPPKPVSGPSTLHTPPESPPAALVGEDILTPALGEFPKDDGLLTAADVGLSLGGAPLAFLSSIAAETGGIAAGSLANLLPGVDQTPEEIAEASAAGGEAVAGKFFQPRTEKGQEIVGHVGEAIEKFLTPARKFGESAKRVESEVVDEFFELPLGTFDAFPRLGRVMEIAAELAQFEAVGVGIKPLTSRIKPLVKQITEGKKLTPQERTLLKEEIETVAPDKSGGLLDAIEAAETEVAVKAQKVTPVKVVPLKVKFEGNQLVADKLLEVAATKKGFSKKAYERAAKVVAKQKDDIGLVDPLGIEGIGPKTGAEIKRLVGERPKIEEPVVDATPPVSEELVAHHVSPDGTLGNTRVEMATEGFGEYAFLDRSDAVAFAGDRIISEQKFNLKKPLTVTDESYFLSESPKVEEPLSPSDSPFLKANKQAFQDAKPKITEEGTFLDQTLANAHLTIRLTNAGFDGLIMKEPGAQQWVVKLDRPQAEQYIKDNIKKPTPTEPAPTPDIQSFGSVADLKEVGLRTADRRRFTKLDSAERTAEVKGGRVVKVGEKFAVALREETAVLKKFDTIEEAEAAGLSVGSETTLAEVPSPPLGDIHFETIQIGDQFFRGSTAIGPKEGVGEVPTRVPREEILVDPTTDAVIPEPKVTPALTKEQVVKQFTDERNRSVQKLNEANERAPQRRKVTDEGVEIVEPVTKAVIVPEDVALADKRFATFKNEADALAYKEAEGMTGELTQDPLSGEWIVEPEFKTLEGSEYEFDTALREQAVDNFEPTERYGSDGFTGVEEGGDIGALSPTGTKSLVDIFNNERGSIEIGTPDFEALKRNVERTKQIIKNASKAGKAIPEYLDTLGISPESKEAFLRNLEQLKFDEQAIRDADPISASILSPNEADIVHQRVKKGTNGRIKHVPVTRDNLSTIKGARSDVKFSGKTIASKFLKELETRVNAFDRFDPKSGFGTTVRQTLFDPWLEKLTESRKEEQRLIKDVIKPLQKSMTKQERKDLGIAWASEQKGGIEALKADGITEIPKLNSTQLEAKAILSRHFETLLDRINHVRINTGREPIPRLDNYFTFIRNQNTM
ncbi:MAG: hypothetical protein KAS32_22270, partial [Candidatus Peribacteraceae bacterium]|nr:hypothetical protein [Candidatus Peribacteraceae bacterium]